MEEYRSEKIIINDYSFLKNTDFKKEKDLKEFIMFNIDKFVKVQLEDKLINAYDEYQIIDQVYFGPRNRRIDIYLECKKHNYIIELKNPKYKSENTKALGQLLNYARQFSDSKKKMVLITTFFDIETAKTIEYYKLPIKYIYFSKNVTLEYGGQR